MTAPRPPLTEDPVPVPGESTRASTARESESARGADAPAHAQVHHPVAARHYLWIVGAVLVLLAALHWLGPVLTPFLIGAILAYLGTPAVDRAEAHGVPRAIATLVVILIIGLLLAALFLVLVPLIQSEIATAMARLPDLFSQFTDRLAPWLSQRLGITLPLDFDSIRAFISENAQEAKNLSMTL
ncbi:MAG: AI-2E family transporter, partial [Betaproteobacteria bacterium]|nr:AI-2E family transporter [Betaproteobacteria bacterium]